MCGGKLRSDAEEERREKSGEQGRDLKLDNHGWKRTEEEKKMSHALEKVAKEVGVESITAGNYTEITHPTVPLTHLLNPSVAIAYLMHKAPYVFPVVGGRKVRRSKRTAGYFRSGFERGYLLR